MIYDNLCYNRVSQHTVRRRQRVDQIFLGCGLGRENTIEVGAEKMNKILTIRATFTKIQK